MVSVPGALAAILEQVRRLPSEEVSLIEARGRVLAEDVHAGEDLPGLARSAGAG